MAISDSTLLTTELRATVIAAVRTAFLAVGIASTIFILCSIAVPFSAGLLSSSLPRIKTIIFTWLSPSYLFITVHFIIILIWKLRDHNFRQNEEEFQYLSKQLEIPGPIPPLVPDLLDSEQDPFKSGDTELDESHETMDATWKNIVEKSTAAAEAATRPPMRKSDTWERCGRDREESSDVAKERKFRKSETFRRISMGREELYMLADAFIGTHYAQRRIQRQEPKQQNIRMVNAAC